MKIVQTFWSGGHNPMEYGYGWPHAEYNLMSWTLSCHSLRQHYDRVELYTDKRGYEVLIEKLRLPYTKVHIVYNDDLCLPQHWAYAKIKTYAMQTEPFLHIDGDMYFPKPLPQELLKAPLIAQNREIGTAYYQGMMERVLAHPEFKLPDFILNAFANGNMASYNMGIFGGSDLNFIQRYCQLVFGFFEKNQMNKPSVEFSNEECNVLFEQIFMATMADKEKIEVRGLVPSSIIDNGYQNKDFANLKQYEEKLFFHLLGGMKRGKDNCRQLAKNLLRIHPTHYRLICREFRQNRTPILIADDNRSEIFRYKLHIWNNLAEWERHNQTEIEEQEIHAVRNKENGLANYEKDLLYERANLFSIYVLSEKSEEKSKELLHARLGCPKNFSLKYIGITPVSHQIGYEEFYLTEDEIEILAIVGRKCLNYDQIIRPIMEKYHKKSITTTERLENFYKREIERMTELGILITNQKKNLFY